MYYPSQIGHEDEARFRSEDAFVYPSRVENFPDANNDKNHSKQKGNKSDDDRGRGIDAETTLYLRNTVLQYMATDRPEVKEQMEGAIATVLRFNKKDLDFVKTKRDAARSWTNYFVS